MRVEQTGTLEDLNKLTRDQFHQLWFIESYTDGMIAKKFGTTRKEVKRKRKELRLNWFNSAVLYIAGGTRYHKKNMWINRKPK